MNILVIPSWYPNGKDKLMGIYHKEFCEALSKRDNINVNMLFIDRQRISEPLKYLIIKKHIIVSENSYKTYIYRMLDIHKISRNLQMHNYCKTLEKAFKWYLKHNVKPDVIHAQVTLPAGYAACKLGKKYNIPVVVTEHASYFEKFFSKDNFQYSNKDYLYSKYVLDNSYFTTVSKYMADKLSKYGKVDVLPNLVDTKIFNMKKEKIEGIKAIMISSLRANKNIDHAIEALKYIIQTKKVKNVSLTVVGDGFYEDYYKKKCNELEMSDYVNFVGRKNKKEIANLLKSHNILIIASNLETFCIPGIEALASGTPIVSTRCLGPEEYVDEKCGKLVTVGKPKEMADTIIDVYNNLDRYDVKYLQKVADKFSAKTVTDKAISIYKSVIK